jgi:hypothetical protein
MLLFDYSFQGVANDWLVQAKINFVECYFARTQRRCFGIRGSSDSCGLRYGLPFCAKRTEMKDGNEIS